MYQLETDIEKLHKPSYPVPYNTDIKGIVDGMLEFMEANNAMGLAAVQIGLLMDLFIVKDITMKPYVFVNPMVVLPREDGWVEMGETCLSFPGKVVQVERPKHILISYTDQHWQKFRRQKFSNEVARCIYHEYDHLRGRVVMDYVSTDKVLVFGDIYGRTPLRFAGM